MEKQKKQYGIITSLYLPHSLHEALKIYSELSNQKINKIITIAVLEYLNQQVIARDFPVVS